MTFLYPNRHTASGSSTHSFNTNPVLGQLAMSEKANAELIESNFEKFAENAGWETSELAKHVHEAFVEDDDDDLMNGISFEGSEDTDNSDKAKDDETPKPNLKDGEIGCPKCDFTTESEHGLKSHFGRKHEGSLDDFEGSETSETGDFPIPYEHSDSPNDPESYDNPEAIMTREAIRNHDSYDGETDPNKLQHYQGKHGVCEVCGLWASMAGDTCKSCESGSNGSNTSNGSNGSNGLTVAQVQTAFTDLTKQEAKELRNEYENGLWDSIQSGYNQKHA